jgi:hypothetical protein
VQERIDQGEEPRDILFKNFPGNVPNSALMNTKKIPDDNWAAYLLKAKMKAMKLLNSSA